MSNKNPWAEIGKLFDPPKVEEKNKPKEEEKPKKQKAQKAIRRKHGKDSKI